MAGGGDHPGANKREREAAGRPKRAKRKKPSEDPAAGGGGGAKGKPQPVTDKDKPVAAKEMSESRKPDYNLEQELTVLWVKMRGHDVSKEDIIKLVTEAICKMDGKYLGISGSHVNASFLQTCVKWCSQLENGTVRRHIIRMLKKLIKKLAISDYGCLVVFEELTKQLKELIFDKTGRRQLLQLLHTLCSRYLTPTDLICLNYNVPSLTSTDEASGSATEVNLDDVADKEHGGSEDTLVASDSKKDPMKWRRELSVKSELCEALIETCIEHVGDLLQTNCLRGILYEDPRTSQCYSF